MCVCWWEPWGTQWFHDGSLRGCPPHMSLQSPPHRCSHSRCQWTLRQQQSASASASCSGSSVSSSSHPCHLFTHKETTVQETVFPDSKVQQFAVLWLHYLVSRFNSANFFWSSSLDMRLMCPLAKEISLYTGWLKSLFDGEGESSEAESPAGQILLQGLAWQKGNLASDTRHTKQYVGAFITGGQQCYAKINVFVCC